MSTVLYIFLLACSVFLSGCCSARHTLEDRVPEKEPHRMIRIQNLRLSDKTLTLDYQVSNPFSDDIRVCQDTCVFGCTQHVKTIIDGETLWIRLRSKIERDTVVLPNPPGISKYLRLRLGESYSGSILLDLPIMKLPLVYSLREEREKERKQIVLHRAVLEVGYFGPRLNKAFGGISKAPKEFGIKEGIVVVGGYHYLPSSVYIVEKVVGGQAREVTYIVESWPTLRAEESATVVVTDVDIPCSIVVDNE